jgi:hypothetical protein
MAKLNVNVVVMFKFLQDEIIQPTPELKLLQIMELMAVF